MFDKDNIDYGVLTVSTEKSSIVLYVNFSR